MTSIQVQSLRGAIINQLQSSKGVAIKVQSLGRMTTN
jgi:hypothetical protein